MNRCDTSTPSVNNAPDLTSNLYDKLWENIHNKEARVWTFLSFYGAAITLFFSTNVSNDLRILGFPIVLLISFWAINFVLQAEWWGVRNLLMIRRIQASSPSIAAIVPSKYQSSSYDPDTLYCLSLMVLGAMSAVVFSSFLFFLEKHDECAISRTSDLELCKLILNNRCFIELAIRGIGILLLFCMFGTREKHIDQYWNLVLGYRRTDGVSVNDVELAKAWRRDRSKYSHRFQLFALLAFVILGPSFHAISSLSGWVGTTGLILLGAFLWMERMYTNWPCSAAQLPNGDAGHATGFSFSHCRNIFRSGMSGQDRLYGILACVFWVAVLATLYGRVSGECVDG
jgi:hypothetical protein